MRDRIKRLNKDLTRYKAITLVNSIMLSLLLVWSFIKPTTGDTVTATGGNVDSVISVSSDTPETVYRNEVISRAKNRGYFTASEYATFEGVDKETIYRRLNAGIITGAQKVGGRWRIFCD